MMKNIRKVSCVLLIMASLFTIGCKKDFLDKKPATNLNIPTTLADMRLLLDNTAVLNRSPAIGEESADDYYMTFEEWQNQYSPKDANIYIWAKEIWAGKTNVADWNKPYEQVLYANVVLEQLDKIDKNALNEVDYNNIKGNALFLRAWSFFDLAQIFAVPYDIRTYDTDPGIPLRLTADINSPTTRASLRETYNQILEDAIQAKTLLSTLTSAKSGNRPSKPAAFAFLSRIFLTMRDYKQSGLYADSALKLTNALMDYNTLDTASSTPFLYDNAEVIYQSYLVDNNPIIYVSNSINYSIDTTLYKAYEPYDLRKFLYFQNNAGFINKKGTYSSNSLNSNGLTTDELFLTRAECSVRNGNVNAGVEDLNKLLQTRYSTGKYHSFTTSNPADALNKILLERRKELVMRGLRWNDIRRLNKEGYNILLKRSLNGQVYTLLPNDPKYALPIPPDVISLSGIKQNDR